MWEDTVIALFQFSEARKNNSIINDLNPKPSRVIRFQFAAKIF